MKIASLRLQKARVNSAIGIGQPLPFNRLLAFIQEIVDIILSETATLSLSGLTQCREESLEMFRGVYPLSEAKGST